MDQYFRDTLEGLKTAAQHMQRASEEIQLAGQALVQTVDAALHAKNEHEELRVTVARLEGLVLQLGGELQEARKEIRDLRGGPAQ